MRSLGQILQGIISFRHHYIMKITFADSLKDESDVNLDLVKVSKESELIDGTYTTGLQKKIINENVGKCETYILKDMITQNSIGIVSVMLKGGDELEYKIRDIDAFIYNVMINESVRGRGYAGVMIKKLGLALKSKNINEAYLAVSTDNPSAIRAYQKVGFEVVGEKLFMRTLKRNIPYYSI